MAKLLEVCVDSVESAINAAQGGAMRLELCACLAVGGISPDEDLFRMVREQVDLPIRVLLRPRGGDFLYSEAEFELLRRQVRRFAALEADGVVIGALTADGRLDEPRMAELITLAGGRGVTLHRAFDVCRDPFEALEAARRLGVDTILTSGQQAKLYGGCGAAAAARRALRRGADPRRRGRERGCDPPFAARDRRGRLPSLREADMGQRHELPARKRADGSARPERI